MVPSIVALHGGPKITHSTSVGRLTDGKDCQCYRRHPEKPQVEPCHFLVSPWIDLRRPRRVYVWTSKFAAYGERQYLHDNRAKLPIRLVRLSAPSGGGLRHFFRDRNILPNPT